ncbi:MAG: S-methyl-5'-thioadenosine phosphorylase [Clostridia bacterium]|nr:MAG: S-methyl-5'-thioadenosine phosphorylase [Clostridia bacterium]
MAARAQVGIFGGTGFYDFLEDFQEIKVETPYGPPSDKIALGTWAGKQVAFLPRHGRDHSLPPHRVNYRANVWAMKELGVTHIIGPCAAGSLHPDLKPGDLVVCDQFVDRTTGRADTFYDGPITTHIGAADPYCPKLRQIAIDKAGEVGFTIHPHGTVVVIQGPRFSTRAESRWFSSNGWHVINMTQYPECILARELEICYVNLSLITDYDVGLEGHPDIRPVNHEEVTRVFGASIGPLKKLVKLIIAAIPPERTCECSRSLAGARIE